MRGPAFPYLSYALFAVGVLLVIVLLSWIAQRVRSTSIERSFIFRYPFMLRALTFFGAFVIPATILPLIRAFRLRGDDSWYIVGPTLLIASIAIPLYWENIRYFVWVTPAGIERRSAWRPRRFFAWDDISEVRYNTFNSWFVFRTENGQAFRVHAMIARVDEFLRLIEQYLPATSLICARTGYERLGRALPKLGNEPILEALPPRR